MLVLGFEDPKFTGEIIAELQRLKEQDIVRLIDAMAVQKDANGDITALQISDLSPEEAQEFGAIVGALIGLGEAGEEGAEAGAIAGAAALEDGHVFDEAEVWYAADTIPNGTAAAIALIEHRWAIPLREKIQAAGGVALADQWLHPEDLIAVGLAAAGAGSAGA
jgi:uncharacterized membrane protein